MAIYYVKNGGNDSNDGLSDATAWATTNKVNSYQASLQPGDVIMFKRGGRYCTNGNQALTPTKSGESGRPIVYTAYGEGDPPTFIRSNTLGPWTGPDANGVYTTTTTTISGLYEDGILLRKASDATCGNGSYYTSGSGTITVYYKPTSGTPNDHTVWRETGNALDFTGASYVTFDSLRFVSGIGNSASLSADRTGITFTNCEFRNVFYINAALAPYTLNNITIDSCKFFHNYRYGLYLFNQDNTRNPIDGIRITNNVFMNINVSLDPAYPGVAAIETAAEGLFQRRIGCSQLLHGHVQFAHRRPAGFLSRLQVL